ncbi:hypothetical protein H6F42_06755 [Pseudanabaena sp. FACHB-1998]|uniref:hypothetical protein n=1 Tax=Pseudanabaena sp. FACHB-1998 TaxID=2692858 RepID=UPI001680FFB1|nr:hypothetical protein [Pseudanabaena sp. FACHB-1998]MBD2176613.1 hypothetical protein [Pseudanabaena sp. FACHB-1998]
MSLPNPKSVHDVNEAWFAQFFVGSMVAIAFLTVVLSCLPSQTGSRQPLQNKVSMIPVVLQKAMAIQENI